MGNQYVIKVRTRDDILQLSPIFHRHACENYFSKLKRDRPIWLRVNTDHIISSGYSEKADFEECPYFNGELHYPDVVREFTSPLEFLQFVGISDCDAVSTAVIDDIF